MPNLAHDEMLLENPPSFAELPDGEYGKGLIFSGNAKYLPLQQFISQHNPRHLRVVVVDNCVIGLVQKEDPQVLKAKAAEVKVSAKVEKPESSEVAKLAETEQNEPAEPAVQMRKGPGGRMFPVK